VSKEPNVNKFVRIAASLAALGVAGVLWVGCAAPRPDNLGVNGGRLSDCPSSPNCVSSQADPADTEHYAAPLKIDGDAAASWERAKQAALSLPGAKLLEERDGYAAFECTTSLMRFVDDVELLLDTPAGVIHLRSSSRIGHSDLGANRKRVEALRAAYTTAR